MANSHIHKISILGIGAIGTECARLITEEHLCDVLVLCNRNQDKARAVAMDLLQSITSYQPQKMIDIQSGAVDPELIQGSSLIIITAGVRNEPGEKRDTVAVPNIKMLDSIVASCEQSISGSTLVLVATNPVELVTWSVHDRLSHRLGTRNVFGLGTTIDTMRFRSMLAQRLKVNPKCVSACLIGEHSSEILPLWDRVAIDGVGLTDIDPKLSGELLADLKGAVRDEVIGAADEMRRLGRVTGFTTGGAVLTVVRAICNNERSILPVCTIIHPDKQDPVCISVPCLLTPNGICKPIIPTMNDQDSKKFAQICDVIGAKYRAIQDALRS